MPARPSAVYDCMIFLQAAINRNGPAFRCLEAVEVGHVSLIICPAIIEELHDVLTRPQLRNRFRQLTPGRVTDLLREIVAISNHQTNPQRHFALGRDPDDEVYLNVALQASADFLVTWNARHLTYLMGSDEPEAIDFRKRFPGLRILDPPSYLQAIQFVSG